MNYRRLGRSGLKVSPICLGTAQCNWWVNETDSHNIFDAYFSAGGNFIDTADVYPALGDGIGGAASEEIVGRWIAARKVRDQIVVATKVSGRMGLGPNDVGLSRRHILAAVESSLRRLQTDYIDIYQAHDDYFDVPMEETLGAFENLIQRGLVRYIGCSNYAAWRIMKAISFCANKHINTYISTQTKYNLIDRSKFETELESLCIEECVSCLPYNPLAKGFLSGRYTRDGSLPNTPRADGVRKLYFNRRGWSIVDTVRDVAQRNNSTCSQVALAWLLQRPSVTAPVVGFSSVEHVVDAMKSAELALEQNDVLELDRASEWQSVSVL